MNFTTFKDATQNPQFQNVKDITPQQVQQAQKEILIIDVRENDEWAGDLGHIQDAKLINLGNIPQQISDVSQDKTIVFVCRSGGRSARAASFFNEQGYSHIYNMKGGMMLWNQLGLPTSKN